MYQINTNADIAVKTGSIVTYREREWIVVPSETKEMLMLRPLGGSAREELGVFKSLNNNLAYELKYERIRPSSFPMPDPSDVKDHIAVKLLWDSARLLLRDGAAPFRSPGYLSFRPRPYQLVPLIMALRQPIIRLLIADDVGIGKTIEAGLIARELMIRGEVRRLAVVCPPYLCQQWQNELKEKFQLDAEVIRSGTVSRLERLTPPDTSIFRHLKHFVASIDLLKSERYRYSFLRDCPDMVIVDEVHGAAEPPGASTSKVQQQRHELLKALAADEERNIVLMTATPHSGVESSFLSLLGLLKPEFRNYNLSELTEKRRKNLAKHFIQRRRADVIDWLGEKTPFPERDTENPEQPYSFGKEYLAFFQKVYNYARDLVQSAETLTGWKKRMRFWSALALMRCIASSPAAAEATLGKRADNEESFDLPEGITEEEIDAGFSPSVYDYSEADSLTDTAPTVIMDAQERDSERGKKDRDSFREFAREARKLRGEKDLKLTKLIEVVNDILQKGYNPIIWCRYIATSEYLAKELSENIHGKYTNLGVMAVNGTLSDEDRRLKVQELSKYENRVLVATDCLSEGINLQEYFNAVIHYDLPWNPNRLEQREGRVDRFGQQSERVKAVMIYGSDNPVDGAVLEVLLRKAWEIHRDLGIHVPVPVDSENIVETVMTSLFKREPAPFKQLQLFDDEDGETTKLVNNVHLQWKQAADREKKSRTRFAQHSIKPEEVEKEMKETDAVLGEPDDVRKFLQESGQRLGYNLQSSRDKVWTLTGQTALPGFVKARIGEIPNPWTITFDSPSPANAVYIGRNHPLVEGLSEYFMDVAFNFPGENVPVSRCGAIRSGIVPRRLAFFLLRLRYLMHEGKTDAPGLAEEAVVWGLEGLPPDTDIIMPDRAGEIFRSVAPDANIPSGEKRELIAETLDWWDDLQPAVNEMIQERKNQLQESYIRVRKAIRRERIKIEPQFPPDLLGVLVVLPVPKGVER